MIALRRGIVYPPLLMPSSPRAALASWMLLCGAAGIPLSLLWDYSWESTIGIDLVWAPPHVATYLAVGLAAGAALTSIARAASLGAWVALWGALAFLTAFFFDRWWQAGYGLVAGLWHPPQLLKAAAFFAIALGAWLEGARRQEERGGAIAFALAGGVVLALIFVVTLPANFANRQHSAAFHRIVCGTYPLVLVALAAAGRSRFPATTAALAAMLLVAATVWLLPLVPGSPQVAPIYHPRDRLLPPPFPLLLVAPALALDALLRIFPKRSERAPGWGGAAEAGLAFGVVFLAAQWPFASFLLSPAADHGFFAGGGKHWPVFIRVAPGAETAFWKMPGDEFDFRAVLLAAGLAIVAARLGLWLGAWMKQVRR